MKQILEDTICDVVRDFVYYGREEDEDLPSGSIQRMVGCGDTSIEEITGVFKRELEKGLS